MDIWGGGRRSCFLSHAIGTFGEICPVISDILKFLWKILQSDSDVSSILCALESIHAALAVMAFNDMPKQLYKEEVLFSILL